MKIFYRTVKLILIVFILSVLLTGLTIKLFFKERRNLNFYFNFSVKALDILEEWVLRDEYKKNILLRVEKYKNDFNDLISGEIEKLAFLKLDNEFLESIFVYIVSKKPDKLDTYFSKFSKIKDVVIIDRKADLVYKKSDIPYELSWRNLDRENELKIENGKLIFIKNYSDKFFDVEFQIVAILDSQEILSFLKGSPFPASYLIDDKIIKNERFPQSWLKGINPKEQQRIYKGIYNMVVFPLINKEFYYGSLVILYPTRDFGSILVLLLKILLFLIIILSLYEIDRYIEGKIKSRDVINKQRRQQRKLAGAKNKHEETDRDYEKSLDWIGKYIEKTEGKR